MDNQPSREQLESIQKICGSIAREYRSICAGLPDTSIEDCTQEAVMGCLRAWDRYNPEKRLSTWAGTIAKRRIIDLLRRSGRRSANFIKMTSEVRAPKHHHEIADIVSDRNLLEWAVERYAAIRINFLPARARPKPGRPPVSTPAHLMLVYALKQHTGLSCERLAYLIRQRRDLREAVGMGSWSPSAKWIELAVAEIRRSAGVSS